MGTELAERQTEDPYGSEELTPARAAWIIVKSYPNRPEKDGEGYIRQVSVLLATYPEWVRRKVVHPERGIVGKCQWVPTPYEIRELCRDEMAKAAKLEAAKKPAALPEPEFHVSPEERARCVAKAKEFTKLVRDTAGTLNAKNPRPGVQRPGDEHAGILKSQIYLDHIAEKDDVGNSDAIAEKEMEE